MNETPKSLSILIATHNRVKLLLQTLESIAELETPPDVAIELIVCANACTDETTAACGEPLATLPFAARSIIETTPGLSAARNRLLAEARGDILAFLDDDIYISRGWISSLLAVFAQYPGDIVAGRVQLWWQAVQRPKWLSRRAEHMLSSVDHGERVCELFSGGELAGANMAMRRRVLASVPRFNTSLGRNAKAMIAGDDTFFVEQALHAGHRLFYSPHASVLHWVAPERIKLDYLGRAAAGIGTGKVRMLKDISSGRCRQLKMENSLKYGLYTGLELASAAIGYKKGRVNQHIRRMMCRGVLDALAEAPAGTATGPTKASGS